MAFNKNAKLEIDGNVEDQGVIGDISPIRKNDIWLGGFSSGKNIFDTTNGLYQNGYNGCVLQLGITAQNGKGESFGDEDISSMVQKKENARCVDNCVPSYGK